MILKRFVCETFMFNVVFSIVLRVQISLGGESHRTRAHGIPCEFSANFAVCLNLYLETAMLSLSIAARSVHWWGLCLPTYRQTFRHQASNKPKPYNMWFFFQSVLTATVLVQNYQTPTNSWHKNKNGLLDLYVFPCRVRVRDIVNSNSPPNPPGMGPAARPKPQEFGLSSTPMLWQYDILSLRWMDEWIWMMVMLGATQRFVAS